MSFRGNFSEISRSFVTLLLDFDSSYLRIITYHIFRVITCSNFFSSLLYSCFDVPIRLISLVKINIVSDKAGCESEMVGLFVTDQRK